MADEPSSFLARLKQHHLYGVVVAYAVVVGFLIQLVSRAFPYFGWADAVPAVIIILIAGFPVVVVLAWLLIKPKDPAKSDTWQRRHWKLSAAVTVAVIVLVVISGFYGLRFSERRAERLAASTTTPSLTEAQSSISATPSAATTIPAKSIAVLAFADLSPKHDQGYFSDGMSDEIRNALAQINDLKVAGRDSSAYFKGRDETLRAIGKTLGVATALEGSVRKQGDAVRITVQLVRIADDTQLWSHAYDGNLSDVFRLQENIARSVTDQLKVVLDASQQTQLVNVGTTNTAAYTLYLKATDAFNRRDYKAMGDAIGWLDQAIALDPDFARAHAQLAMVNVTGKAQYGASLDEAEKQARIAIALDPKLPVPWNALAFLARKQRHFVDARGDGSRAGVGAGRCLGDLL